MSRSGDIGGKRRVPLEWGASIKRLRAQDDRTESRGSDDEVSPDMRIVPTIEFASNELAADRLAFAFEPVKLPESGDTFCARNLQFDMEQELVGRRDALAAVETKAPLIADGRSLPQLVAAMRNLIGADSDPWVLTVAAGKMKRLDMDGAGSPLVRTRTAEVQASGAEKIRLGKFLIDVKTGKVSGPRGAIRTTPSNESLLKLLGDAYLSTPGEPVGLESLAGALVNATGRELKRQMTLLNKLIGGHVKETPGIGYCLTPGAGGGASSAKRPAKRRKTGPRSASPGGDSKAAKRVEACGLVISLKKNWVELPGGDRVSLTPKEAAVLRALAAGQSDYEALAIAAECDRSNYPKKHVQDFVRGIRGKIGHDRIETVKGGYALRVPPLGDTASVGLRESTTYDCPEADSTSAHPPDSLTGLVELMARKAAQMNFRLLVKGDKHEFSFDQPMLEVTPGRGVEVAEFQGARSAETRPDLPRPIQACGISAAPVRAVLKKHVEEVKLSPAQTKLYEALEAAQRNEEDPVASYETLMAVSGCTRKNLRTEISRIRTAAGLTIDSYEKRGYRLKLQENPSRVVKLGPPGTVVRAGGFEIDPESGTIREPGKKVELKLNEWQGRLVKALALRTNQWIRTDELFEGERDAVTVCVDKLVNRLGPHVISRNGDQLRLNGCAVRSSREKINVGDLRIRPNAKTIKVSGGKPIKLTDREMNILIALTHGPHDWQALASVALAVGKTAQSSVSTAVRSLRKKIGENYILSTLEGYSLNPDVMEGGA